MSGCLRLSMLRVPVVLSLAGAVAGLPGLAVAQGAGDVAGAAEANRGGRSTAEPPAPGPGPQSQEAPPDRQASPLPSAEADQRSVEAPRGEVAIVPDDQAPGGPTPLSGVTSGDLMGRSVRNNAGQVVGQVRELVIDPQDGEVTFLVVDVGPYLQMGERPVALSWNDIQVTPDRLTTSLSRDELARAETYRRGIIPPQSAQRPER